MEKNLKKFIVGIVLFISGIIGSGLNLISNSIVLSSNGNNLIPFGMFLVTLTAGIVGLVYMIKYLKK